MWDKDDERFLQKLKKGRDERHKFLKLIEADPTGYDALGIIRNYRSFLKESDDYIAELEERRARGNDG